MVKKMFTGKVEARNGQVSRVDILKGWLAEHHAPADIDVPAGLRRLPSLGCRTFTWKGRNIAQICFTFEDGKIAHLFVIKEEAWHGAPPEGHPQFSSHGEWTMASWREAGATYIMARVGNQSDLEKLFL